MFQKTFTDGTKVGGTDFRNSKRHFKKETLDFKMLFFMMDLLVN
jgi:hypothetical protein